MKRKIALLTACAAIAGLALGCSGDDRHGSAPISSSPPPPPPPPTSSNQMLDTAQVLALAKQTSETSAPFAVNDGALTLTDTSETSASININGM